jgi:hypothetical protein
LAIAREARRVEGKGERRLRTEVRIGHPDKVGRC